MPPPLRLLAQSIQRNLFSRLHFTSFQVCAYCLACLLDVCLARAQLYIFLQSQVGEAPQNIC